jgi:hypothetical protein
MQSVALVRNHFFWAHGRRNLFAKGSSLHLTITLDHCKGEYTYHHASEEEQENE